MGDYVERCVQLKVGAIALTNHGNTGDNEEIAVALHEHGIVLVHGVEISTLFGDFTIYSPDLEYLSTFNDIQDAPRPGSIADHAAIVWVHPRAGGGRSASAYYPGLENLVAPMVDAVELYNGNWLDKRSIGIAQRIADVTGLPCTGGSDAHKGEQLMACYTEIPGIIRGTEDVVKAIKNRTVMPCQRQRKPRGFGLFGR